MKATHQREIELRIPKKILMIKNQDFHDRQRAFAFKWASLLLFLGSIYCVFLFYSDPRLGIASGLILLMLSVLEFRRIAPTLVLACPCCETSCSVPKHDNQFQCPTCFNTMVITYDYNYDAKWSLSGQPPKYRAKGAWAHLASCLRCILDDPNSTFKASLVVIPIASLFIAVPNFGKTPEASATPKQIRITGEPTPADALPNIKLHKQCFNYSPYDTALLSLTEEALYFNPIIYNIIKDGTKLDLAASEDIGTILVNPKANSIYRYHAIDKNGVIFETYTYDKTGLKVANTTTLPVGDSVQIAVTLDFEGRSLYLFKVDPKGSIKVDRYRINPKGILEPDSRSARAIGPISIEPDSLLKVYTDKTQRFFLLAHSRRSFAATKLIHYEVNSEGAFEIKSQRDFGDSYDELHFRPDHRFARVQNRDRSESFKLGPNGEIDKGATLVKKPLLDLATGYAAELPTGYSLVGPSQLHSVDDETDRSTLLRKDSAPTSAFWVTDTDIGAAYGLTSDEYGGVRPSYLQINQAFGLDLRNYQALHTISKHHQRPVSLHYLIIRK